MGAPGTNIKWVQVPFEGDDISNLELTHAQAAAKVWEKENQGWEFTGNFRKIEADVTHDDEKPKEEESQPQEEEA